MGRGFEACRSGVGKKDIEGVAAALAVVLIVNTEVSNSVLVSHIDGRHLVNRCDQRDSGKDLFGSARSAGRINAINVDSLQYRRGRTD